MAATDRLTTYGDESRAEDVLDVVEILTAEENWFLNNLGKTTATDTIHESMTDTLRDPGSNAVAEQEDYDVSESSTPSRLTNIVENVAIPFAVSKTQQEIEKHTGENELARQTSKALKDWGNSAELKGQAQHKSPLIMGKSFGTTLRKVLYRLQRLSEETLFQREATVRTT